MTILIKETILDFSHSLSDFVIRKKHLEQSRISNFNSILAELTHLSTQRSILAQQTVKLNEEILTRFLVIYKESKERNRQTSCDFNLFRLFKIGETLHSYLLANILDPNSEHGQGNLFLYSFLNKIGIKNPEDGDGQWTVTAEKGRIDILIKRNHPHSVVIIENKSNLAIDQPNQLYKYWYREIHIPNKNKDIDVDYTAQERFRIVYLTPTHWKLPSEDSLTKPKGLLDLPQRIPLDPIIWKYDEHITNWLREALELVPEDNHRLREYLKQYIELWK